MRSLTPIKEISWKQVSWHGMSRWLFTAQKSRVTCLSGIHRQKQSQDFRAPIPKQLHPLHHHNASKPSTASSGRKGSFQAAFVSYYPFSCQ